MANRHRTGDVAPRPHALAPNVLSAPRTLAFWLVSPALHAPLRPLPQGLAHRTSPKRHSAEAIAVFAESLRAVRVHRGFSQQDLAERAGIDRTHVSLVECGRRQCQLSTICTLAAALHVNPGDLLPVLFLREQPPPPNPSSPAPTRPEPPRHL